MTEEATATFPIVIDPVYGERGFENVQPSDLLLHYLQIVQKQSRVLETLKEARIGDIHNTVTDELYSGTTGIDVSLLSFQKKYVEFVPLSEGGGFVASYTDYTCPYNLAELSSSFVKGHFELENGNELHPGYFMLVYVIKPVQIPAIIILRGTQHKVARRWISNAQLIRRDGRRVNIYVPIYHLSVVDNQSKAFMNKGWQLTFTQTFADQHEDTNLLTNLVTYLDIFAKTPVYSLEARSNDDDIAY